MVLYKLIVAYDGTRFNGFQRQITNQEMQDRQRRQQQRIVRTDNAEHNKHVNVKNNNKNKNKKDKQQHQQQGQSLSYPSKRPRFDEMTGRRRKCVQTVQDCIEDVISSWTGQSVCDINLKFAGRTDKGVHANGQVIVANINKQKKPTGKKKPTEDNDDGTNDIDNDHHADDDDDDGDDGCITTAKNLSWLHVMNSINSRLPIDISVVSVVKLSSLSNLSTTNLFDPRKDAKSKMYTYTIKYRRHTKLTTKVVDGGGNKNNNGGGPNTFRHAFDSPCMWVVPWTLDDSHMSTLCKLIQGTHNFAPFVHKSDRRDSDRDHTIHLHTFKYTILNETQTTTASNDPEEEKNLGPVVTGEFALESQGFRRAMCRNIVGFCVDVCRGLFDDDGGGGDGGDGGGNDKFDYYNDLWGTTTGEAQEQEQVQHVEYVASKIQSAPACGLCLESVTY